MDQEVIDSRFVWFCTGCQRCEIGCPMGVKLVKVWMAAKAARPGTRFPECSTRAWLWSSRPATTWASRRMTI
jgi:heterodisulfide reductase subunit C